VIQLSSAWEKIFTDDEYQKIFDVPKGTDTFYVMAHSPDEQPGMKFKEEMPAPNLSVVPGPAPHGASETITTGAAQGAPAQGAVASAH
jgi:hypothetical protein